MDITAGQLIAWVIVGALAGSVAGALVKGQKTGFGHAKNMAIGLLGAVIGGILFKLFDVNLGLDDLVITFQDMVAALIGSLLLLFGMWIYRKKKGSKAPAA